MFGGTSLKWWNGDQAKGIGCYNHRHLEKWNLPGFDAGSHAYDIYAVISEYSDTVGDKAFFSFCSSPTGVTQMKLWPSTNNKRNFSVVPSCALSYNSPNGARIVTCHMADSNQRLYEGKTLVHSTTNNDDSLPEVDQCWIGISDSSGAGAGNSLELDVWHLIVCKNPSPHSTSTRESIVDWLVQYYNSNTSLL